jgi:hypothetical protein
VFIPYAPAIFFLHPVFFFVQLFLGADAGAEKGFFSIGLRAQNIGHGRHTNEYMETEGHAK